MAGMKCDGCERLLQYKAEIVAVYRKDCVVYAQLVAEDTPGSGVAARLGATGKYHPSCYEVARERDPGLPKPAG